MGPFPPSVARRNLISGLCSASKEEIAEWWVTWGNMTILSALGHLPNG